MSTVVPPAAAPARKSRGPGLFLLGCVLARHRSLLRLPVDTLEMVVHRGRQLPTTPGAARLEDLAAAFGGHAGAEAVRLDAPADARLKRSLGHCSKTSGDHAARWELRP